MSSALQFDTLNTRDGSSSIGVERLIKGACAAWINSSGVSNVIRGSYNVSSITDTGTGAYTINFATPLPDVNYAAVGATDSFVLSTRTRTVNGCDVVTFSSTTGTPADYSQNSVSIFR
jgi:hypothetical protein